MGRLGAEVQLREESSGEDWCRLSVGVGEAMGSLGSQRTGLSVAAWGVLPMGQIGRRLTDTVFGLTYEPPTAVD